MNKIFSTLCLIAVGVVALSATAPALSRLVSALGPVILVAGVVAGALRIVWTHTRRW